MNCFVEVVGTAWVELYHAIFVSGSRRDEETSMIRMGAVESDLERCMRTLQDREAGLLRTIETCTEAARGRKKIGDLQGAKKKLRERHRHEAQLTRIQNSIAVVENHTDTLHGVELNKTIVDALRASGRALKSMGLKGGVSEVDRIVMDVDEQLREANEISKAIGEGAYGGMEDASEADLDAELDILDEPLERDAPATDDSIYGRLPRVPSLENLGPVPLQPERPRQPAPCRQEAHAA